MSSVTLRNERRSNTALPARNYPEGITSFSPALADNVGLRWVTIIKNPNPERVASPFCREWIQPLQGWELFC